MKVAYISTYPPRECGIATFNNNLFKAIASNSDSKLLTDSGFVVALTDAENLHQYEYPEEVKYIIRQDHQKDYIQAANYINASAADVCVLEHEFGIYGGKNGVYILPLLCRLEKPLISVFHTILREPSHLQKTVIQEIASHSTKIVVMSRKAEEFLKDIYQIPEEKIALIEHGVPDFPSVAANPVKAQSRFRNKRVLFTFGLISRNKGLETVIQALPKIVKEHPDVIYVVLGNTHPGVLKNSGEEYRDHLKSLATQLHVDKHLVFIKDFASEKDLFHYLSAVDIYITPYLSEAQISSGTLSYAVGAGAAIVSTPYWHAQELLDNERGRFFNFKDANMLANIVNELLADKTKLEKLKKNAYQYGLKLRWPQVGAKYLELLKEAISSFHIEKHFVQPIINLELMPNFSLAHIKLLTDSTGLVQHTKYGIPNLKEGYCLDDNARALIMALMAYEQNKSEEAMNLLPIYLSYIHYMQREDGSFRNFLSFDRKFLEEVGSEDSFGRAIWALGYTICCSPNNSYKDFAKEIFRFAVPQFKVLHHLRGIANTMIGLCYYLKAYPNDKQMQYELDMLTDNLINAYEIQRNEAWQWFEEKMTYDNAILPLALLHAYETMGRDKAKEIGMCTLNFLEKVTWRDGYLCPVGNMGWYYCGSNIPLFDQQPIEAMAVVLMYLQAYRVTKSSEYISKMFQSFRWFLGENILHASLYDPETKGCFDGLQVDGINRNQGAESTLAYMISYLAVLNAFELEYQYNKSVLVDHA